MARFIDLLNRKAGSRFMNPDLLIFIADYQLAEIDEMENPTPPVAEDFPCVAPPHDLFFAEAKSYAIPGAWMGAFCTSVRRNETKFIPEFGMEEVILNGEDFETVEMIYGAEPESGQWLLLVQAIHGYEKGNRLEVSICPYAATILLGKNGEILTPLDKVRYHEQLYIPDKFMEYMDVYPLPLENATNHLPFVLRLLATLNCANVKPQDVSPPAKLSRSHEKKYRVPMSAYKVLTVRGQNISEVEHIYKGGTHSSPRKHLVRGHFKRRATGVFWWGSFMRGRGETGSIMKKYEVKPNGKNST